MLPNSIRNPPFSVATVPDPGKHGHLEIPHPFSGKTLKKYPFSRGKNPPFSQGLQDLGEGGRVSRQAAQHRLELGAEPSQARIRVVHAVHFSRRTCVERSGLNQLNEKIIAGIVI